MALLRVKSFTSVDALSAPRTPLKRYSLSVLRSGCMYHAVTPEIRGNEEEVETRVFTIKDELCLACKTRRR